MQAAGKEEQMERVAGEFRDAMQNRDLAALLHLFREDCEIELFDLKLRGHDGVEKWFNWTFGHMKAMQFERLSSAVGGDIFYEEYLLSGVIHNGKKTQSRQARVLVFEGGRVKSFRLYMDRLQFADSVVNDFAGRLIVKKFIEVSVKGMKP